MPNMRERILDEYKPEDFNGDLRQVFDLMPKIPSIRNRKAYSQYRYKFDRGETSELARVLYARTVNLLSHSHLLPSVQEIVARRIKLHIDGGINEAYYKVPTGIYAKLGLHNESGGAFNPDNVQDISSYFLKDEMQAMVHFREHVTVRQIDLYQKAKSDYMERYQDEP